MLITLIALFSGAACAVVGLGAAAIAPALFLFGALEPSVAVATAIVAIAPLKALTALRPSVRAASDRRRVNLLISGGLPAAVFSVVTFAVIQRRAPLQIDTFSLEAIGLTLLACIAIAAVSVLRRETGTRAGGDLSDTALIAIGVAGGALAAASAIASSALVLALLLVSDRASSVRKLIATSAAFGAIILALAAVEYLTLGVLDIASAYHVIGASTAGFALGLVVRTALKTQRLRTNGAPLGA